MLDNFLNDLEELLHSAPYSSVDILPLVKQYTQDKTNDEAVKIRLRISGIIQQLKDSDFVQVGNDFNFLLVAMVYQQFSEDPIYVRGTIKFENDYKEKRKPPVQPITHITTHGDNSPIAGHSLTMGDIVQLSSKNLDFKADQAEPSSQPEIKVSNIKKALSYIGDHIVKIIVGLIILYLAIKFGLKK